MDNLFEALEKAIESGDKEEISRIQKRILKGGRDTTLDESFINAMRGKTLYKQIVKALNEDVTLSTMEYAKTVSSLITHYMIESQQSGLPLRDYPVQELYVILGDFVNGVDERIAVGHMRDFIVDRFGEYL